MNNKFKNRSNLLFGIVLMLISSILLILSTNTFNIIETYIQLEFNNNKFFIYIWLFILGFVLLTTYIIEKTIYRFKSVREKIDENDERIFTIKSLSQSKTYEIMSTAFFISILSLAIFGYLNKVSIILFGIVYSFCEVYRVIQNYLLNKKM